MQAGPASSHSCAPQLAPRATQQTRPTRAALQSLVDRSCSHSRAAPHCLHGRVGAHCREEEESGAAHARGSGRRCCVGALRSAFATPYSGGARRRAAFAARPPRRTTRRSPARPYAGRSTACCARRGAQARLELRTSAPGQADSAVCEPDLEHWWVRTRQRSGHGRIAPGGVRWRLVCS